jgi:hypothetical protein
MSHIIGKVYEVSKESINKLIKELEQKIEQIKDYEEALAKYPANSHAYNVLKKYKGDK